MVIKKEGKREEGRGKMEDGMLDHTHIFVIDIRLFDRVQFKRN
jgi:hypothetical protein